MVDAELQGAECLGALLGPRLLGMLRRTRGVCFEGSYYISVTMDGLIERPFCFLEKHEPIITAVPFLTSVFFLK